MAKVTPEGKFQEELIKYLKSSGFLVIRTQMGAQSGYPDITVFVNGFSVLMELKRPDGKGKPTKQQEKVIEELRKRDVICGIVSSKEEADALVKEAVKRKWKK